MAQAIVFDLGGVLMRFDPIGFSRIFTKTEEDAKALNQALFSNLTWAWLDAGAISEETALMVAKAHLPERLWSSAERALAEWDLHRTPIDETHELVRRLKEAGYGIYILSNAGVRFPRIVDRLPCAGCVDGWMASAFEHVVKPDPQIFRIFCSRFGLAPEACLFVDDNSDNVAGAAVAGMRSHRFVSADELETWLRAQGISC